MFSRRVTARRANSLASLNPGFTVLLSMYFIARITVNKKALVFRLGLFYLLGAFMPFAELRAFRPDNAKLLALSVSVFTVLPCMGLPCSGNIPSGP